MNDAPRVATSPSPPGLEVVDRVVDGPKFSRRALLQPRPQRFLADAERVRTLLA